MNSVAGHRSYGKLDLVIVGISICGFIIVLILIINRFLCSKSTAIAELPISVGRLRGLSKEIIQSFTELLHSQAKLNKSVDQSTSCYICLAKYEDADALRVLPACGHIFHVKCVDPWLRFHPTCPVCRKSPMSIPSTAPVDLSPKFNSNEYVSPARSG